MQPSDERVVVGRVLKPRALDGEAFMFPLTDHLERFDSLKVARCEFPNGTSTDVRIAYVRTYGKRQAVKLEGVDSSADIIPYRNALLTIPRDAVYELPEDTFYVFELEGLPAVTESGEPLGTVREVLTFPANDVYVIDRDGGEFMVPAVKEWVEVDREAGRVVVKNADSLLS